MIEAEDDFPLSERGTTPGRSEPKSFGKLPAFTDCFPDAADEITQELEKLSQLIDSTGRQHNANLQLVQHGVRSLGEHIQSALRHLEDEAAISRRNERILHRNLELLADATFHKNIRPNGWQYPFVPDTIPAPPPP